MASTNQGFEYKKAEAVYLQAKTLDEKLRALEEMIRKCPKHKSSEKMLANLKARYVKLKEKIENQSKKSRGSKTGIKKQGIQVVLIGLTNSGKSSILASLTNAKPEIAFFPYTTKQPVVGALELDGVKMQLIDMPAINYETFDTGIANNADILLVMITRLSELEEIFHFLDKAIGKKIIIFNKADLLSQEEKRKIEATLKSKKYDFCFFSTKTLEGISELKEKIFQSAGVIRIYTKEPGKKENEIDKEPIIMKPGSTIEDVARKISKDLAKNIKEIRITGPSSKFPNQKIGLDHVVKDKDIVEFHAR